MAAVSGFGGRVKIDNVIFKANRWTIDYVLETDDATGTVGTPDLPFDNATNSFKHRMPIKTVYPKNIDINVTIEAFYDTNYGIFGDAGLAEGALNPKKNFYLSPGRTVKLELFTAKHIAGKESAAYEFTDFLILTFNHVLEVRGVAKITFSGKCNSKDYFFPNL
jgi:hypothetical protein